MQLSFTGRPEDLEEVVTREEMPRELAIKILEETGIRTEATFGYRSQGKHQALVKRDTLSGSGVKSIVGVRKDGDSWERALGDGWIPGETLFTIEDAARQADAYQLLVNDAALRGVWEIIRPTLTEGNYVGTSHGYAFYHHGLTGIVLPNNVDGGMNAPKGTGDMVRLKFTEGGGVNSSIAIHQNATGRAWDRVKAISKLAGSGYDYGTTIKNEVNSDHFGENNFLLGQTWAINQSSFNALVAQGSSHYNAFVNSSEQFTEVILPLIGKYGVGEIYKRAYDAKQLGTFLMYRAAVKEATKDVLARLYDSVESGENAENANRENSRPDANDRLEEKLKLVEGSPMWLAGNEVRAKEKDRTYDMKITNWALAGVVVGAIEAQFQKLIDKGHSAGEAHNETEEESSQILRRLYSERGIGHLLRYCSMTAQVGALRWYPEHMKAIQPIFSNMQPTYPMEIVPGIPSTPTRPDIEVVGRVVRSLRL